MSNDWFLLRDGRRYGPFSFAQLQQMTTTGQLLPVDLLAQTEGGPWMPAAQVGGLFAPSHKSGQDSPFDFSAGTEGEGEGSPPAPTSREPNSAQKNKFVPFAAAGVLGVALLGAVVFVLARNGTRETPAKDTASKGQTSDGKSNARSGNRRPGKTYLDDVIAERGPPIGSYARKHNTSSSADEFLHVWKNGTTGYDLVFTAVLTKVSEPEFVQSIQTNFDKNRLDAILKGYRPR